MKIKIAMTLAAGVALSALATPAQAQLLGLCPSIILPPPCIIFDYKKLADIATQHAQEVQKIVQTVEQIKQLKQATTQIGTDITGIAKINIQAPSINNLTNPLTQAGSIASVADTVGAKFFGGKGASTDTASNLIQQREIAANDANTEAMAYSLMSGNDLAKAETSSKRVGKAVRCSKSLREDWAANSSVKEQIVSARAQQSYLLTAFLKTQAAHNVRWMPTDLSQKTTPSTTTAADPILDSAPDLPKVTALQGLLQKAQMALGALSVVQMTNSIQSTIRGVISDYQNTQARKINVTNTLMSQLSSFTNNSGRGDPQSAMTTSLAALGAMDQQMATMRAQPITTLSGAFAQRNIDVAQLAQSEVDPRQFLGTWTDPMKYKNTIAVANALMNGPLRGQIRGSGDQDKFRQALADYNDVRLEEAWKKVYADEAQTQLDQTKTTIAEEEKQQGGPIAGPTTVASLQTIVAQANDIGKQIGSGTDDASKQAASTILTKLQELVGGGSTSLPVVAVDGPGAPTTAIASAIVPAITPFRVIVGTNRQKGLQP